MDEIGRCLLEDLSENNSNVKGLAFTYSGGFRMIPAKTEILVRGAFDNSRSNPANPDPSKEVRYGPQTWDEMFIGYMMYTVPRRSGSRQS